MISTGAYNYINVLDKAADASWTRNTVIANNIANDDTQEVTVLMKISRTWTYLH
jgi:flagellar basal body rod protein FlgC